MKAKRDHYIPQAYLESWRDSSGIVYIWDRERNIIHNGDPRSVMFIYGHLTKDEYGEAIDEYFRRYEQQIMPVIKKICSHSHVFMLSDWEFVLLSGYLESQYIRVPKVADINENIVPYLLQYIFPNTGVIQNLRNLLAIMNWSVLRSLGLSFVTTDSPVIIFDQNIFPDEQILQRETLNEFMHKRDVTVCFPLDPYHILYMQHFVEFPDNREAFVTINYRNIHERLVDHVNQLMVKFSDRRIVCNNLSYLKKLSNGAEHVSRR